MSDSNIVVLEGRGSDRQPDADVIAMIRRLLENAESGQLRGLVAVGQMHDGELLTLMTGTYGPTTMAGQLAYAQKRVLELVES